MIGANQQIRSLLGSGVERVKVVVTLQNIGGLEEGILWVDYAFRRNTSRYPKPIVQKVPESTKFYIDGRFFCPQNYDKKVQKIVSTYFYVFVFGIVLFYTL